MQQTIKLLIESQPIASKRHRALRLTGHQYDPQKKEKAVVKWQIIKQLQALKRSNFYLFDNCVYFDEAQFFEVRFVYYMKTPKTLQRALKCDSEGVFVCRKKPDLDNLEKFYLDCMSGVVYPDDAMIVSLSSSKWYSLDPRTEIEVTAHFRDGKEPYRWGKTLC